MTAVATEQPAPALRSELPLFASWTNLIVAALIYICTNPGRTQYMGVITEPILEEFHLSRSAFGQLNFWATMIVAVLSFGFGTLLDRLGLYRSAWSMTALTAAATALTALADGPWTLFAAVTLARLFGQGVLAVTSTSLLGKSFRPRHAPIAAAVYLALTAVFYAGVLQWIRVGLVELEWTWRSVWLVIAVGIGCSAMLSMLFITPPTVLPPDRVAMKASPAGEKTVWEAVRHPLFIVFGLYCLINGTAVKGMDVFMESLLKDRGFGREMFFDSLMIGVLSLVVFKFLVAWLCRVWSIGKVLALGMLLSSAVVGSVSLLDTPNNVYVWSLLKSLAWSVYVVVYFSVWAYAFGRRDLSQIQGAIHVVTITSSALGPLLLGICRDRLGSYLPALHLFAVMIFLLGIAMLLVKVPHADPDGIATDT
ncbi:MFS transporter [Limnoglobus roseus]|uniref:MFS transporter n=1 Tax=Limnoglobus roseus TaxID=2598579 RepID=A0A5C1AUH7_9BACT|nr:MFS transporter [Limnoglobus roseus]QEL20894.1 MFS transporter [Limnoglobus roseus]